MHVKISSTNEPANVTNNHSQEIRQAFLDGSSDEDAAAFRVVMYSHDTMGIGHVRRNLLIASEIKLRIPNASILVIAGIKEASIFAQSAGIDCITLPSFQKDVNGSYTSRSLGIPTNEVLDLRSQTILTAIQSYKPDLLIADKTPCGAGGELLPALEWLTSATSCRCVLGLREILDSPAIVIDEWKQMHAFKIIHRHFESIWIYGDPTVFDAIAEYKFSPDIAACTTYTGYLDAKTRLQNIECNGSPVEQPYVLCTFGGGQDGEALALQFVQAMRATGRASVLLTGPYMPTSTKQVIQSLTKDIPSLKVVEFVHEGDLLIKHASHVISMGGYNTLTAILSHQKHALIVPRISPRAEQSIRATRLAEMGHIRTIHPSDLDSDGINNWLAETNCPVPESSVQLDFGGLDRICELVQAFVSSAIPPRKRHGSYVNSKCSS